MSRIILEMLGRRKVGSMVIDFWTGNPQEFVAGTLITFTSFTTKEHVLFRLESGINSGYPVSHVVNANLGTLANKFNMLEEVYLAAEKTKNRHLAVQPLSVFGGLLPLNQSYQIALAILLGAKETNKFGTHIKRVTFISASLLEYNRGQQELFAQVPTVSYW